MYVEKGRVLSSYVMLQCDAAGAAVFKAGFTSEEAHVHLSLSLVAAIWFIMGKKSLVFALKY